MTPHAVDGKCQRPNCIVIYRRRARDWWRRRYWAVCIYCNQTWGPCVTKEGAQAKADLLNEWQETWTP